LYGSVGRQYIGFDYFRSHSKRAGQCDTALEIPDLCV
jgi:hypothetical protein